MSRIKYTIPYEGNPIMRYWKTGRTDGRHFKVVHATKVDIFSNYPIHFENCFHTFCIILANNYNQITQSYSKNYQYQDSEASSTCDVMYFTTNVLSWYLRTPQITLYIKTLMEIHFEFIEKLKLPPPPISYRKKITHYNFFSLRVIF